MKQEDQDTSLSIEMNDSLYSQEDGQEDESIPGVEIDAEIEEMKRKVAQLEEAERSSREKAEQEEEAKVQDLQEQLQAHSGVVMNPVAAVVSSAPTVTLASPSLGPTIAVPPNLGNAAMIGAGQMTAEQQAALDESSIYVGQVDYEASPEELQAHFLTCGTINRVTIICDKATGRPKGYAYIEFLEKDSVESALLLNESLFKGRQLKVTPKRVNIPGVTLRGGRGRGRRGAPPPFFRPPGGRRGFGRGYRGGYRGFYPGYNPYGGYGGYGY